MTTIKQMAQTRAPRSVMLIRLVVGGVFLTEGILKFLYPGELGSGRFTKIGIPAPEVMGPFVGRAGVPKAWADILRWPGGNATRSP